MNLRPHLCHLLSVLKIHDPDCEYCNETCGYEMRKRLEELNGLTKKTLSLKDWDHEEGVRVFDPKPCEVPLISATAHQKKVG